VAALHHDLYRGVGRAAPVGRRATAGPGQLGNVQTRFRFLAWFERWTLEAYAVHGAEVVSYFRWRRHRSRREQMHAGSNLPDGREDVASDEVRAVMRDLAQLPDSTREQAPVALVFD